MTTSVDEVCNGILTNAKPLVFIDTCTILDVIRVLHRDSISDTNTASALKMIDLSRQNKLKLVSAENVKQEFVKHIDETASQAEKAISKLNQSIKSLTSFHRLDSNNMMTTPDLESFQWHTKARNIAENLLAECIIVKREDDYILRARRRVEENIAPAKKGKAEQSDCEIIECFLDLSSRLRHNNFNEQITFITANTNDFGKIGKPISPLDEQFIAVQANYATDLGHALHLNET